MNAERHRILADLFMPDIDKRASATAVDTFALVFTDDDIGESGTIFENEDRVLLAGFCLALTDIC